MKIKENKQRSSVWQKFAGKLRKKFFKDPPKKENGPKSLNFCNYIVFLIGYLARRIRACLVNGLTSDVETNVVCNVLI